jgi:hypothetical protein
VVAECSGMSLDWGCKIRMNAGLSGRGHRSLGYFPLVRRKGRQDFVFLTRRDPEVVERASQLGCNLVKLLGRDVELAMGFFQPQGGAPGFVATNERSPPATLQTHSVRMNSALAACPARWCATHEARGSSILGRRWVLDDRIAEVVDHR